MKQFLRSLCTLLMLVVWASGFAAEKTYSYTFKYGDFSAKKKTSTLNGVNWTLAVDSWKGKESYAWDGSKQSFKIGKGKDDCPNKNVTITTSEITGTIKSVTVNCSTNSGASTQLKVLVGGTQIGKQVSLTNSSKNYDFTGSAEGTIVLSFSDLSTPLYLKSINVVFEDGPSKTATTLDFGFATKTVNINETFTATATLKAGETAISGAVTYTSSNSKVATVNETTGEVSPLTAGKATITATFAGTSEYKSSTAYYDLTVVDPNAKEVSTTFDFKRPELYNYGVTKINGNGGTPAFGDGAGDVMLNKTIVSGDVTITNTKVASYGTRFWNNTDLRVYEESEHIVSVPEGYKITSISIIPTEDNYKKYKIGENEVGEDWTGSAQTVKIVYTKNSRLLSMTVTYTKPSTPTLTLDEKAEDTENVLLGTESGKVYDVTLTRTLTAGKWNTICLPFDVTAEQVESVLKATGNVKEFDKEDKATATIFFKPATELKAGVPYLIKPTVAATELVFKGVKITATSADASFGSDYGVCGTFVPYKLSTDGTELFLKTDGKFYVPAKDKETMKGFRAYFIAPKNTAGAALNLSFGEATGIDGVAADAVKSVKIYNVNGQYVGTNLDALPKGLYIVGGKKVLK